MVFFACDACGQSLKKNQVDKHLRGCKRCQFMSCIDCNQEFWGDDYKAHIKCISEDEKYGGKNYKPKTSTNKGENKQNDWMELIREVISTSNVKPHLVHVMQEIVQQPNLPRKQAKFEKFLQNSLRHKNPEILTEAWNIFSKAQEKIKLLKGENKQQVGSTSEASANSKNSQNEDCGQKKIITEEALLNFKHETNEMQTNGFQVKKKKLKTTEISESPQCEGDQNGIESEIKRKKSHKKKAKCKQRQSDEQSNENEVTQVTESFEVPDSSMLAKKKNKKRKRDKEESEDHATETSNSLKLELSEQVNQEEVSCQVDPTQTKKKKQKHRKVESEDTAIETPKLNFTKQDTLKEIKSQVDISVPKKKRKKEKHDKEAIEDNGTENSSNLKLKLSEKVNLDKISCQVDVTNPKKKKKKRKLDKVENEDTAIGTSDQNILKEIACQEDITIHKKKKKKQKGVTQ